MNQRKKGKLIVIDGTDGSGKATQIAKLHERLFAEAYAVESLDFPQYYENFFGKLIGQGLAGDLGDWTHLHPKIASVIYAADRFESSRKIKNWLLEGKVVLLDRYVSSNQIHQGGKIHNEEERREFLQWLDTMEHEIFKLPRPDLILYLDIPLALSQELLARKDNRASKKYTKGKGDQHENDIVHLHDAKESGLKLIAENNHWERVVCVDENGKLLSIEAIHEKIYQKVQSFLKSSFFEI